MDYAQPQHSPEAVNGASKRLLRYLAGEDLWSVDIAESIAIVENWRASHAMPLNSLHITLRSRARKIDSAAITAQRMKRMESIALKLNREKKMNLSQMQDIGGCRAVLPDLPHVLHLRDIYLTKKTKHYFIGEKDYISKPRATGYRGIHLKYRFKGEGKTAPWDGLKVEIQIRTQLQHRWATAVEAAGTLTRQALKSNVGPDEWLRLFALMGSVYARREGCPAVPDTPDNLPDLHAEIQAIEREHKLETLLSGYANVYEQIENNPVVRDASLFLLSLDPRARKVSIVGYERAQSKFAHRHYMQRETEARGTGTQVVLVSVDSVKSLKRAYPNYFLDTVDFLGDLKEVIESAADSPSEQLP